MCLVFNFKFCESFSATPLEIDKTFCRPCIWRTRDLQHYVGRWVRIILLYDYCSSSDHLLHWSSFCLLGWVCWKLSYFEHVISLKEGKFCITIGPRKDFSSCIHVWIIRLLLHFRSLEQKIVLWFKTVYSVINNFFLPWGISLKKWFNLISWLQIGCWFITKSMREFAWIE